MRKLDVIFTFIYNNFISVNLVYTASPAIQNKSLIIETRHSFTTKIVNRDSMLFHGNFVEVKVQRLVSKERIIIIFKMYSTLQNALL